MALAPKEFGIFGSRLLVGNFRDGRITALDLSSGATVGQLRESSGSIFAIPGLWALQFGSDAVSGTDKTLFFTAGINNEADGLLGSIKAGQ